MNRQSSAQAVPLRSTNWTRRIWIGLWLGLLLVLLSMPMPPPSLAARAQPDLLALAAQQPDAALSVIVQKTAPGQSVEAQVAKLGGTVTKDLHIINAFAADMPAGAAVELAKADGVRWVSLDAPMVKTGGPDGTVNTTALLNTYDKSVAADKVWAEGYQGSGVTVAVVDSGVAYHDDLNVSYTVKISRILTSVLFDSSSSNTTDFYGHGTHVAGIIGGNGKLSNGQYIGIAPKVNLVSVKVSDDNGTGTTSDAVSGLQWVLANKDLYNIKVVNLSLNSAVNQSYNVDPLDAAVEVLWFNKIVVVVSAGNEGKNPLYPPANDPFVITVGATDDNGTADTTDDVYPSFTSWGATSDGFQKPEIAAPGVNIISTIASAQASLAKQYGDHLVGSKPYHYFRMSGTSMAAPIVAGTVALMLQAQPALNPDQVKQCLTATATALPSNRSRWGEVNAYNAVHCDSAYLVSNSLGAINSNIAASQLLWTGRTPVTWDSVNWNSVNWNSVNWNSVNWNSVNWNSVNWNSDDWSQ